MAYDALKNAAYSLVATAPSPATSGTTLVVTAGEGARFPTGSFDLTIWPAGVQPNWAAGGASAGNFEICRATRSGDTLTLTRAQYGTTARTVVVGDQVAQNLTAAMLAQIEAATLDQIATLNATAADVSLNSHKLTNVTDPASAQDAATKNYVDTALNGLFWKQAVRLATQAALPSNVYNNGASGVGATLTGVGFGALAIDGVTVVTGDRVLVKNEVAPANNGIYVVTTVGAVATLYVLTRAADYNQTSEIQAGDAVYATAGSANVDTSWVMTTTGAITVGTTALVFTQFGGNLVTSVFTRTGAVVAANGDYTAAQVGALAATAAAGGALAGNYPNPTLASPIVANARAVISGVTQLSLPGLHLSGGISTFTLSANRAMYFPFIVTTPITIDQIVFELTTGVAASTCRACIYPADTSWQPGTMVTNTDTGALTTTVAAQGPIATTITATALAAGRYLFWLNASTGNPVFRCIFTNAGILLGYPVALGSSMSFTQIFVAQTYGAPPSTGLAWTGSSVGSVNTFGCPMFLRISTP